MKNNRQNSVELIVIVGPTASGKSDLAVRLAKKYGGEIISADSRQVYKGLDIGSGKITKKEMRGVRHYLLDVASPKRVYTAAHFKRDAERAIRDIRKHGKLPIVVGGTGLCIDALIYGLALPEVKPNPELRRKLERKSAGELFRELRQKDPNRAANIDRFNKRRLIRALEIVAATGKVPKLTDRKTKYNILKIGIAWPPEELRRRIHARLISRLKQGLVREVERLHRNGVSWKRLDDLGLEYRYISRYLRELPRASSRAQARNLLQEMLRQLETAIWHYARRQMTWWRKDKDIRWLKNPAKFSL